VARVFDDPTHGAVLGLGIPPPGVVEPYQSGGSRYRSVTLDCRWATPTPH